MFNTFIIFHLLSLKNPKLAPKNPNLVKYNLERESTILAEPPRMVQLTDPPRIIPLYFQHHFYFENKIFIIAPQTDERTPILFQNLALVRSFMDLCMDLKPYFT